MEQVQPAAATQQQLGRINRYTRRNLTAGEVYIFSVVLCDNEVDRDYERFPTASLETLAGLFLGKTGVFDHAPKAENQSARIFDASVEQTEEVNSLGEPYCRLRAWAYMVRCDKNADLILEIDAGIKKEVSVGCAVESTLCAICGADRKTTACTHNKGELYGGRLCHHLLVNPTDAYEWSFVAVPAQKNAGVTKRRGSPGAEGKTVRVDKARVERLEYLAALGERYESELRAGVLRLGLLGQPDLPAETLEQIAAKLDVEGLESLRKSFEKSAARQYPVTPQLGTRGGEKQKDAGEWFRI